MPPVPKPTILKPLTFQRSTRMAKAKAHEFDVISSFQHGYRNREDQTNLAPNTLITGSQNVLTNVSGRVGVRKGYTLDGAADTSISSILGSYDYLMHTGTTQHLRSGFLTSAANDGKLQFRYKNSAGTVTWYTLLSSLTSTSYQFTNYWDATNLQSLCLMVNGASSITEWTGGVTTYASATSNTITCQGTKSFSQLGFYASGSHHVMINGVDYTATGGWATQTLTGVTPDPTSVTITAGDVIYQLTETTLNSSMTSMPLTSNYLVGTLYNQVYVASGNNNSVYVSKVDNYKDYSKTATRLPGEGATLELDGIPIALAPSEDTMYISAGKDQWWQTKFTLSADLTKESLQIRRLKTAGLQGAQSQGLTCKIANHVVFLSNEPIVNTLGFDENITLVPQIIDLSSSIVNDIDGIGNKGQIIYHKKYIYLSDPTNSKVYIYNMTNPQNPYWEAPQILPIGRFSIIDGNLYGHSYNSSETYKLFDGYNDNGNFIESKAKFAYNSHGQRDNSKSFNQMYMEGYISSNTTLYRDLNFDLDGCATILTDHIIGSDTQIVCIGADDNSLGKFPLGKQPLGGNVNQVTSASLPPKFRVIRESQRIPYYEYSPTFYSNGVDQQWELIAFGPAWMDTSEGQEDITL